MTRLLACLLLLLFAGGCSSSLGVFDTLVPKDGGARLVARDLAFAAHERGKLDVYAPAGVKADARVPVIVFFYGGSWSTGSKDDYGFAGQALAAQGFVVVMPDYRLVQQARYPAFLEDGAAAVRWVRVNAGRFGGDPDRIVLAGHSAGAYNSAMLSLDPRWLGADRAAVKGFIGLAGPYSFLPLDTQTTRQTFGHVEDLPSTQPVNFASRDDPPSLLLVAGKDDLVFPRNSTELARRLADSGARVETRVYDGVGHVGIMSALSTLFRGKAPVLRDISRFARTVTGAQEPPRTR